MEHKAGFVNIVGNPNVGKSTLMNALVGERLSIITSKAQTTRHRILGIVNGEDFQMVLSDTPGIIKPAYKLQERMMDFVKSAFEDADCILYMVELGEKDLKNEAFQKRLTFAEVPVYVIINKIDQGNETLLTESLAHWKEQLPNAVVFAISALENFGVQELLARIIEILPVSPAYYPKDTLTDKPERFFVNESIREKILIHYKKEIPYSVEIDTEEFFEDDHYQNTLRNYGRTRNPKRHYYRSQRRCTKTRRDRGSKRFAKVFWQAGLHRIIRKSEQKLA
jgi:GTP-binding protein Era